MKLTKVIMIVSGIVLLIAILTVVILVTVNGSINGGEEPVSYPIYAVVVLRPPFQPQGPSPSGISGVFTIRQNSSAHPVEMNGTFQGLVASSIHGFHIHEYGDLRNGCLSTGAHFNPAKVDHGSPSDKVRHLGDLGNIKADLAGVAKIKIMDALIKLSGPSSIIGRAIVVHEKEDDLGRAGNDGSRTTGNAGGRAACGIIGLVNSG